MCAGACTLVDSQLRGAAGPGGARLKIPLGLLLPGLGAGGAVSGISSIELMSGGRDLAVATASISLRLSSVGRGLCSMRS
jgi:hypothetical protein